MEQVRLASFAFGLAKPFFMALDAESAHRLALAGLRLLPRWQPPPDDPRLFTRAFGRDFANPIGLAAGFDKNAEASDALLALGFGFIEIGGVTPEPQPGNPRPRAFRLPEAGAVINRYGLNSAGAAQVARRLAARRRSGILGVNLGANKESADRSADYARLIGELGPFADFLTLNISSPNTIGLRDLQGRAFFDELVARAQEARAKAGLATPILVKIAPDLDESALDDLVDIARARGIDGMIVSNTSIARPAALQGLRHGSESGGLSGRPLFRPATILLAKTYLRVEGAFPIIGVGGIASGADALEKIAAGASLIQLYSALIYQGPGLIGEIKSAMLATLTASGAASLAPLIGKDAKTWAAMPN